MDTKASLVRVNLISIPVERIEPNTWNPNEQDEAMFAKEMRSIEAHGFLDPPTVREYEGHYQIIDGEHRWRAAVKLGLKEIPVNNLGLVPDSIAKQLTLLMNDIKGKNKEPRLSALLSSLTEEVPLEELKASLPYSSEEIGHLLKEEPVQVNPESISGLPEAPAHQPLSQGDRDWKTLKFRLPEGVASQWEAQVTRFKQALHPEEKDIAKVSPVMALEAMIQHIAQIPDDQLV